MNAGRAPFHAWIFVTVIWIIGTAGISYIKISDNVRSWKWQYVHEMRKEVDIKEMDLTRPYYENMLSLSAEKLAVGFSEVGNEYVVAWEQSVKEGSMVIVSQPDRSSLYLPTELTSEDQQYISDAFWNQRCACSRKRPIPI